MVILAVELSRVADMWVYEIWMGIDPDNFQIGVNSPHSRNRTRRYRMVSSDCEQQILSPFLGYFGYFSTQSS